MFPAPETVTALAGVPLASLAIFYMYKLSSNHMHDVRDAINHLRDATQENTAMQREFFGWLQGKFGGNND